MRVNKDKFFMASKIILIILMLGTLAFIFVNSALPPEVSEEESAAVGGFIASLLPEGTKLYDFVTEYIRKIAHFTEYGLLGIEVCVYIFLFAKRRGRAVLTALPIPLFVGFTDETIQILSGRGPAISDVWIDIGGFIFFGSVSYAVIIGAVFITKRILEYRRSKAAKTEKSDG